MTPSRRFVRKVSYYVDEIIESLKKDDSNIEEIYWESINLSDLESQSLAKELMNHNHVKVLNLNYTGIGIDGFKSLFDALSHNRVVTHVFLVGNNISDVVVEFLAQMLLKNTSVTNIDLSHNDIGPDGAKYIADALKHNNVVKDLNLSFNEFGSNGVQYLAEALCSNYSIRNIILNHNDVDAEGIRFILKALELNSNVIIDFIQNNIDKTLQKSLVEISRMRTLKHIEKIFRNLGQEMELVELTTLSAKTYPNKQIELIKKVVEKFTEVIKEQHKLLKIEQSNNNYVLDQDSILDKVLAAIKENISKLDDEDQKFAVPFFEKLQQQVNDKKLPNNSTSKQNNMEEEQLGKKTNQYLEILKESLETSGFNLSEQQKLLKYFEVFVKTLEQSYLIAIAMALNGTSLGLKDPLEDIELRVNENSGKNFEFNIRNSLEDIEKEATSISEFLLNLPNLGQKTQDVILEISKSMALIGPIFKIFQKKGLYHGYQTKIQGEKMIKIVEKIDAFDSMVWSVGWNVVLGKSAIIISNNDPRQNREIDALFNFLAKYFHSTDSWLEKKILSRVDSIFDKNKVFDRELEELQDAVKMAIKDAITIVVSFVCGEVKYQDKDEEYNCMKGKLTNLVLSDESFGFDFALSLSLQPIGIANMQVPLRKLRDDEFIDTKDLMPKPCVRPCNIFIQTEIIYKNPILNYPKLFKYCSDELGQDKTLELCQYLSSDLIHEAAGDDYDLAYAGLLSLL
jgi:hypothetical protein